MCVCRVVAHPRVPQVRVTCCGLPSCAPALSRVRFWSCVCGCACACVRVRSPVKVAISRRFTWLQKVHTNTHHDIDIDIDIYLYIFATYIHIATRICLRTACHCSFAESPRHSPARGNGDCPQAGVHAHCDQRRTPACCRTPTRA